MSSYFKKCVIAASLLALGSCSVVGAPASVAAGAGTFGFLLNGLLNKVDEAVETARQAGRDVAIEAGQQSAIAIARMQAAYADSLNLTVDRLGSEIRTELANIETIVGELEGKTYKDARDLVTRAQMLANTIPLANTFPQLLLMRPRLTAPLTSDQLQVTFEGNFVRSAQKGFAPTLKIGAIRLEATEIATGELGFSVPSKLVQTSESGILVTPLFLDVPYPDGVFQTKKVAQFRMPLAVLPPSPGRIQFIPRFNNPTTMNREHVSPEKTAEGHKDDDTVQLCEAATPGWTIVPGSIQQPEITGEMGSKYKDWHDYPGQLNRPGNPGGCLVLVTQR